MTTCATCGFPWGADPVRHAEFCSDRKPSDPMDSADREVAGIMAMTDEQIMSEATSDDIAWANGFKLGLRIGKAASEPTP